MSKIFKAVAASSGASKSLPEALKAAEKTGVLEIPHEAVFLMVDSECRVEVEDGKKI